LDPLRDLPALRKREGRDRSWREEVQERVRSRRQKRAAAGLPLFDEPVAAPTAPPPQSSESAVSRRTEPPAGTQPEAPPSPPARETSICARTPEPDSFEEEIGGAGVPLVAAQLSEVELADLPLHLSRAAAPEPGRAGEGVSRAAAAPDPRQDEARRPDPASPETEPEIDIASPPPQLAPVERPARVGERAQAAALDAALFSLLCLVVVYFTGRTARVGLEALASAWPWLLAYQGLLALFYAGYFTGTTGQTPGKLITGLRVVDTNGRPPGYSRAACRAAAGLVGIAMAGVALLPMAFDPALRALHDRLFQTRVVKG
jgi:uncharacterized RDD family membrane protein YckC